MKNSIYGAEYLVEAIVGHEDKKVSDKGNNIERRYRLRWTGWGQEHDTWEPLSVLENCSDLVGDYHRKQGWSLPTWPKRGDRQRKKSRKALGME